eukprot:Seg1836.3 transcript_id=Seg1836.3/GoldUCD/mRNA.D3Y31 product="Protein FAM3C" protein_id=Seg1836.3/GoldUCD/D3Y31
MSNLALAFALSTIFFINNFQASLLNHGTFFTEITNKGFANVGTHSVIDENFHKCSMSESCSFVVHNVKTRGTRLISSEKDLPSEKHDLIIWKKEPIYNYQPTTVEIEILSAGHEDPGGGNSMITVNGINHSGIFRGFHIVVLSGKTGEFISKEAPDTSYYPGESARLINYISSVQNGSIVLMSVFGDAAKEMSTQAEQAVQSLGATTRLALVQKNNTVDSRFRGSFAMVTRKGGAKPSWFVEKSASRGKGPSHIPKMNIPLDSH